MPQDGKDFHSINIRNEFTISSKIVPKITLHDLILKYSELNNKKIYKVLSEDSNLYSVEDGLKWLEKLFQSENKDWSFYLIFYLKLKIKMKSISLQLSHYY